MKRVLAFGALLVTALAQAAGNPLAGTSWQLQSIQSMDDAQGTTIVSEPSHFVIEFGHDGRALLRLDCNRGNGDYTVVPAGDGSSGGLNFGPVATTRAFCQAPQLGERVARDLANVRSYRIKDGKLALSLMADGGIYAWERLRTAPVSTANKPVVKPVRFGKGQSSAMIRDRIAGYSYIDYQVPAGAGQRMAVALKGSNGANYFNLLPPGSDGSAMVIGEFSDNRVDVMLPDEGDYTIRVFMNRAAARRGEQSRFTLSVGVTGVALRPVAAGTDALIPGTRYHASTTVPCAPVLVETRECEVFVVRRGFDGTATVVLRWDGSEKRRILFVKGRPIAADAPQAMAFSRNERGWKVTFDGETYFEIPESLIFGG